MSELTREQFVDAIDNISDEAIKEDYPQDIEQVLAHDAALRATIEQLTTEMTALLEGQPLANGLYVHHLFCNGDRRQPAGTPGVSCSCKVVSREVTEQQAQEIVRLKGQVRDQRSDLIDYCEKRLALVKADLAAMTTERDVLSHSREALVETVKELRDQLATAQARVTELEQWQAIVMGSGTEQETVIRMAATEYTKTAVQCWKDKVRELETHLATTKAQAVTLATVLRGMDLLYSREVDEILDDVLAD